MRHRGFFVWVMLACGLIGNIPQIQAQDKTKKQAATTEKKQTPKPTKPEKQATVEELVRQAGPSLAVITFLGRDGKTEGLGTGFVIDSNGLIATNFHVIGQARPIFVKLHDGQEHAVVSVQASDRLLDLAVLKIDAKNLPALPLGNSDDVETGQPVVVLGNPRGLEHSVVAGVVSARREIEGQPLLQLAIPIEQGNSGGPVLDMQGRVQGIVNMKSLVTQNLGFAVEINSLKPLLAKPNPILMSRWLTIGSLDEKEWKPLMGSRWWQRAGHIRVEGWGGGFGGRSLCLAVKEPPKPPYEVGVYLKLEDESGAAGLVFQADGKDKHYGFYPSNGRLRFSRFDGPDVLSWNVLEELQTHHYRPGQWNWLKVRVDKDKIQCFVNDHLVAESTDSELAAGSVGLAKFRSTVAEFKQFQIAATLPPRTAPDDVLERIKTQIAGLPLEGSFQPELLTKLQGEGSLGVQALREQAEALEQQAARLKQLALEVHRERVRKELKELLAGDDSKIDLLRAALLLAWLDNDELDVTNYLKQVDRMAADLKESLPEKADDAAKLERLRKYLFEEMGFHGSRGDYYNRANSYLNEVLEDREGLPITLSVVYIELARRLGLQAVGVGLPGHFVVRVVPAQGDAQLIDVFNGGKVLSRFDAEELVKDNGGPQLEDQHLTPSSKESIIVRMLHNLMNVRQRAENFEGMLPYLDTILTLRPDSADERWIRAVISFQLNRRLQALADVEWILDKEPKSLDMTQVYRLRRMLEDVK